MQRRWRTAWEERGAIAPTTGVLLILLLAIVALVVDIGQVHHAKIQLQQAVDAAALAGAGQLDGRADQAQRATRTAEATVVANDVLARLVDLDTESVSVVLGHWDISPASFDKPFAERWSPGGIPLNAVQVRARVEVDHAFFLFAPRTGVPVDALAITKTVNPVMPLTIISCIPVASTTGNPGSLPGDSPCDIRYYNFSPDTDDSAAWTGLTFNKSASEIAAMLDGPEGRMLYEQVVFGQGLDNLGIENTAPAAGECVSQDLFIGCGLGMIDGEPVAPPESFPSPPGFPYPAQPLARDPVTGIYQPGGFDPMNGYRQNGALPRWYNLVDDGTLKTDDHFVRVWTLDGLLLKGAGETFAAYQARLQGYFDGTVTPPAPFDDGRLVGEEGLISDSLKPAERNAIAAAYGVASSAVGYWPKPQEIVSRSGYPKVNVTNGTAASILDAFFSNAEVAWGEDLACAEHEPLAGETLRVQVPVIFAGYCEAWKALSNTSEKHTLNYVGLADFLVTRAWKTPEDYACAGNFVDGAGCGAALMTPAPLVGGEFRRVNRNDKAIEGLIKIPELTGAAGNSAVRVFLVE